jgi:crotonobetainyl-CoA:carnitine CoA-transferase CaiB-like acyl-CoA transferase
VRNLVAALDDRGAGLAADHGGDPSGVLDARRPFLALATPGRTSAGGRCRLVQCADGWIALSLARPDDVELVPAWLESGDDPVVAWCDGAPQDWTVIELACAGRTVASLTERAALCGLAVFGVGEFAGAVPVLAERVGDADPLPMGTGRAPRVVNLAGLWAGPLAADVCARLGARVVTVESATRPDGARGTPGFHAWLHGRDKVATLDLRTEDGRRRLSGLLSEADVVIEGSRPRALLQMGIDARSMVATGPRVWVSITGAGRGEPHGMRIGFGDDAAAGGGLVGWVGDGPSFVADAAADPLTGLVAAREIVHRLDSGGRWLSDVALARVAGSVPS